MKLKYWITSGFQTLLYVVLATSVYGLMMTLQMSNMDWMDLLMLLPIYLLLFGAMMQMAMTIGVYKLSLNLVLAFGSTRNEALLGLQLLRLIPALSTTALICILLALAGENAIVSPGSALPVALGVTGGILAVLSSQTRWLQYLADHMGFSWLVFGIGLILYALSMIPEHRTVWKYSVRM